MTKSLEKEWFIEAPWGRICIVAWGNCHDPPVLLCHGSADCAATFGPLIRLLPTNFYYIAMETPGNGRSDPFPPGLMIHLYDMVYALKRVVDHFRWDQFVYMAHSSGTYIGVMYNLCCPGKMSKVIALDPAPLAYSVPHEEFAQWYKRFYSKHYENYEKNNRARDQSDDVDIDRALDKIKNNRGVTEDVAKTILERMSVPVGNGLVRFSFDVRTRNLTPTPFSSDYLTKIFTSIETPTLTFVAKNSEALGFFDNSPYIYDESLYPAKNYRIFRVPGSHDVHLNHPERVASQISLFLLHGLKGLDSKSKL